MILTSWPSKFQACASYLKKSNGWHRLILAFALGSAMALTMPPINFFPLLWVCFPALILLLQGTKNNGQAFFVGWSFAFGFFVFGLYWIAASMFVDIHKFWWAVPISVVGLPAFFAVYYGIASVLARKFGLQDLAGTLAFALLWFLADYARGHMFTGFPWNLIGYSWSAVLPLLQTTSVIGIYGLTLLTLVVVCLPACFKQRSKASPFIFFISLAILATIGVAGLIRLDTTAVAQVADVRLRIVQPNIDQGHKWKESEKESHLETLLKLSSSDSPIPITHVIWPETASPFYLGEDAWHRKEIALHTPPSTFVLTGVIRRDLDEGGTLHFYNSLVVVDGLSRLVAGYDKSHLVPFGEFMPFRKILPFDTLAASAVDFTPGPGPRSLRILGLPPFSPLICYEAIFPGHVVDPQDRPDLMINITNDGWYGRTSGPYQHFAIARVRAIEEGLPLIRAANTGISGVIDPLGRIQARLGVGKQGFIDSDLPTPLPLTFFARWREAPIWILFFCLCASVFYMRKKA